MPQKSDSGNEKMEKKTGKQANLKKGHRTSLICNAHIDPVWQWSREEGIAAAIATFRSVVKLAEEYEFVFCQNESFLYEYTERYDPELFSEIKELVKAGRWHIMGGWYLQPDCNMPCGESLIRHIETGRKFFRDKFGALPSVAVNVDSFGHSRGLVQILKKCGYKGYVVGRPGRELLPLPAEQFLWKGFDGSEIAVCRIAKYASLMGHAAEHIEKMEKGFREEAALVFWGLGNHGGGPSKKDLKEIRHRQMQGKEWIHSTPEHFFSEISPQAVWCRPLTHVFPGCYSSMSSIKRAHALLERDLYRTEAVCALAEILYGKTYCRESLEEAQRALMQLEFHDVLAGTCTKSGEDDSLRLAAQGSEILSRAFSEAFFLMADEAEPAEEGEYPILVFNSLPYARTACIEAEFTLCPSHDGKDDDSRIWVTDNSGNLLPSQKIKEESNLNWDCRKRIAFTGTLLPMGITRFSIRAERIGKQSIIRRIQSVERDGYVAAMSGSGTLCRFVSNGVEGIAGEVLPVLFEDNPDPWAMSPEQALRLGKNPVPFEPAEPPRGAFSGISQQRCTESGEVFDRVESFFEKDNSFVRFVWTLYKNLPYADLDVEVLFGERDKVLKIVFPVPFSGEFIGQSVFGREFLEKDGRECVAQRFVAVTNGAGKSLILLNRSSYAFSYEKGILYATLLRGATYCAHPIEDRELIPDDRYTDKIDLGERHFSFRLVCGETDQAGRLAEEFFKGDYALCLFPSGKSKCGDRREITVFPPEISLSAFRKSEEGYLIRLFNSTEKEQNVRICCFDCESEIFMFPFEVKTFVFAQGKLSERDMLV